MYSIIISVWMLHIVATLTPGANTLLISQLAASNHRKSAMFAALGVAVGSASWAALNVLDVNIIFIAFPVLRLTLQIGGGLYLLYLAIRLWKSGTSKANIVDNSVFACRCLSSRTAYKFHQPQSRTVFWQRLLSVLAIESRRRVMRSGGCCHLLQFIGLVFLGGASTFQGVYAGIVSAEATCRRQSGWHRTWLTWVSFFDSVIPRGEVVTGAR